MVKNHQSRTIHLESRRVGRAVEIEMRRGKSLFQALAVAAKAAQKCQKRLNLRTTDGDRS